MTPIKAETRKRKKETRLSLQQIQKLRISVFVCLLLTSCVFAGGAFFLLDRLEEESQRDLYDTIVAEFRSVTIKSINDE